jgi:hypothetical protein
MNRQFTIRAAALLVIFAAATTPASTNAEEGCPEGLDVECEEIVVLGDCTMECEEPSGGECINMLESYLENPDCARLCSSEGGFCFQDGCPDGQERPLCEYYGQNQ